MVSPSLCGYVNNIDFTVNLSMLGTRKKFNELVKIVGNQFSGRLAKIICSEEPGLYSIGTLQLTPSYDPLEGKGELVIEWTTCMSDKTLPETSKWIKKNPQRKLMLQ